MSKHLVDALPAVATPAPAPADAFSVAPDLMGLALHEASAAATWAGTRIHATHVSRSRGPWGIVLAQSPSPGVRMQTLWLVHVLVSAPPAAHSPDED